MRLSSGGSRVSLDKGCGGRGAAAGSRGVAAWVADGGVGDGGGDPGGGGSGRGGMERCRGGEG
jgi:hypothetical protein